MFEVSVILSHFEGAVGLAEMFLRLFILRQILRSGFDHRRLCFVVSGFVEIDFVIDFFSREYIGVAFGLIVFMNLWLVIELIVEGTFDVIL